MITKIKLIIKNKLWVFFIKFNFFRKFILYKLPRYKDKLNKLNNLKLNSKNVVVDVGANNGVVAYYLYDKYKCFIHCYEPNYFLYNILNRIFKKKNKIKCYNFAVSNINSKKKKLYYHKNIIKFDSLELSESSSLEKNKKNISIKNYKYIKTISINKILKKFKEIEILKIDIEGHEYKIMKSVLKNIDKIQKIYLEMHGKSIKSEFHKDYKKWIMLLSKKKEYKKKIIHW